MRDEGFYWVQWRNIPGEWTICECVTLRSGAQRWHQTGDDGSYMDRDFCIIGERIMR